ncbi:unnamed protein product [marine sediment metagenome]|uniref:Carboxypeptidase regulatory-like domain-containing protein n=1 Tax=marine sediment metagenome TaxID=412755 RepID=X1PZF8_9ZZZZ
MAEEIKLLLPGPPREERKISPALIIGAASAGIGLAVILGLYAVAQARPIPPSGECIIWGFVTDGLTGEPLPDVKITLDGLVRYTEWAGQYEIRDIACQEYRIQFSKGGYVTESYDVMAQPKPYEESPPFNISLLPMG